MKKILILLTSAILIFSSVNLVRADCPMCGWFDGSAGTGWMVLWSILVIIITILIVIILVLFIIWLIKQLEKPIKRR